MMSNDIGRFDLDEKSKLMEDQYRLHGDVSKEIFKSMFLMISGYLILFLLISFWFLEHKWGFSLENILLSIVLFFSILGSFIEVNKHEKKLKISFYQLESNLKSIINQ